MLIRDLAWLVALAEHGHVTATAASLGTGQPTLSRALARVEGDLGVRIFERTATGVVITPTGALVVEAARAVTDRYDQLGADLAGILDPDSGTVRLAFLDSMATSLVPRVLGAFHRQAPRVRVLLSQEPSHEIIADLDRGTVELAITSPRPEGPYVFLPLQEERLVVIVPPTHRLRDRRRVALTELSGEELITTPVGFGFRRLVDGLLSAAGASPAISFESQDLATIEGLVAAGLGLAVVPAPFAGVSGSVGLGITGSPGARRTVGLVWRSDRTLAPPAARFRDACAGLSDRSAPPAPAR